MGTGGPQTSVLLFLSYSVAPGDHGYVLVGEPGERAGCLSVSSTRRNLACQGSILKRPMRSQRKARVEDVSAIEQDSAASVHAQ